ncbi:MAG: AraC family transcriptional regulator [Chitinophagaceae bacterium]
MKVIQFTIPVAADNSIHVQEDVLPHFYEHLHRHNEIQLTWIIKGEGTLLTGNYMQQFSPGDVFVLGANQPHLFKSDPQYFDARKKKEIHSLNIFFNPNGFIAPLLSLPEMRGIKKWIMASQHGMQVPKKSCRKITDQILFVKKSNTGARMAAFIELLHQMAEIKKWKIFTAHAFEHRITDTEGLRINNVYQYSMANYTKNISLEEVAKLVHLTPQSFCRYFKKHTAKTYIHFLNEIRVNEACKKFMENKFESIAAVAYQSGFNNVVNFNRVFKNITKHSPGTFIKQYHQDLQD